MKKNVITSAILLAIPALAAAEEKEIQLEPIHVYSAYATPVNQDQTASSVTVLTEKDFSERNATYVSDVLKTVPGVAMSANGGRGALTSLFLRGAESNHTVVIIDGVKMNPVNGGGFDFGGLSLSNIDRIEVLRGEQSALWGSDAMGGVIYITTKSGLYKDKPVNLDFDIGTGSHGTVDGSATVSGYNQGFYYSLHGDSHHTRGISALSDREFLYQGRNGAQYRPSFLGTERDKFHRDNASARVGFDDGKKGVEFLTSHSSQTVRYDSYFDAKDGMNDYKTRIRDTLYKFSGYLGSDQDLFKHKINLNRFKTDNKDYYGRYTARRDDASYQLDFNFDRKGDIKQSLSLLADYNKSGYLGSEYNHKLKLNEKSVALEYRLLSETDHSLSISGRGIDNSQYGHAFNARLAGAYRLSPNLRLHAALGSASQAPNVAEYFGYSGYSIANFDLKSEKSRGGEFGLLTQTSDKRHNLDITYFARNVKDLISDQIVSCITPTWCTYQAQNISGTSHIRGVEMAYSGQLNDKLNVYANYTYTAAKDSSGLQLIRRPKHVANGGLAYQITEHWGSDVNISYVGKRVDDNNRRYQMPSYTLVNLGVNYQLSKNLNIYANLNNVFDRKYESTVRYGQEGRNVYIGLKGSF